MNVLVVGGAGYVGSVLVRELLGHGHKVRVLDRLYFGDVGIRDIAHKIELVRGDMRKFPPSVLDDIEAVINVGGLSNDPCCLPGTKVYTHLSYSSDIEQCPDFVLSKSGEVQPVLEKMSRRYQGEVIGIKITGNEQVWLTSQHRVLVFRPPINPEGGVPKYFERHGADLEWITAGDLHSGDYVFCPTPQVANTRHENEIIEIRHGDRLGGGSSIINVMTKEMFRFLGIYVAEGYASRRIGRIGLALGVHEDELIDSTVNLIKECFNKTPLVQPIPHNGVKILFYNKDLANLLKDWFGPKASKKRLPEFVLSAPVHLLKEFYIGYWQGDGNISNIGQSRITTASYQLKEDLKFILKRMGIYPSEYKRERGNKCMIRGRVVKSRVSYDLIVGSDQLSILWADNSDNRRSQVLQHDNGFLVPIKHIDKKEYDGWVYNLETEDNTFSTPFVVHNCAEYNEEANWQMNAYATVQLAQACLDLGVRRFIFASSASVYDTGIIDSEADDIIQDEETPVNPTRPYSASKRYAEEQLLKVAGNELCPVILRKGTIFGWSPRMRYDLVINTMVKSALSTGVINVHAGGEMWRPLVSIKDVARAYLAVLEAPVEKVNGQIFNVSRRNYRISELALWLKVVLNAMGVNVTVHTTYTQTGVRSYRISNRKLRETLGFEYRHDIEHEVREIVQRAREDGYGDFGSPRYYNIDWMRLLEEAHEIISITGSVFDG